MLDGQLAVDSRRALQRGEAEEGAEEEEEEGSHKAEELRNLKTPHRSGGEQQKNI